MLARGVTPIRVFIVDDHRLMLWGLESMLEAESDMMHVGSATTVREALERLDEAKPDVILLDVIVADGNALESLPAFHTRSKARILVLTGMREDGVNDAAILGGASGVVDKGVARETLLTAIRRVHEGQLWVDRTTAGRVLVEFSRRRATQSVDPELVKLSKLTAREREVIAACSTNPGGSTKVIARTLRISENTLRNHLSSIYTKLGVTNRASLYSYAMRYGLRSGGDQ